MSKITAIEKGYGDDSIFFKVGSNGVTKIDEDLKSVAYDGDGKVSEYLLVYNVYINNEKKHELEPNSGLCISY